MAEHFTEGNKAYEKMLITNKSREKECFWKGRYCEREGSSDEEFIPGRPQSLTA